MCMHMIAAPACRGTQMACSVDGVACQYTPFFQAGHSRAPSTQVLTINRLGKSGIMYDSSYIYMPLVALHHRHSEC